MPSTSAAQHRWIGYLHSNPDAREHSGMSKAKVDEWLHADKDSPWKGRGIRRDAGGGILDPSAVGPLGMTPTTQNQNPTVQNAVQTYAQMPEEKLQETLARLGGPSSPQGSVVARVLRQRQMSPQTGQQPTAQFKRGGAMKRADGGDMGISPSQGSPWWSRAESRGAETSGGGFLHGSSPGRADTVQTTAPGGSYILPADVVSGLGQGNSLAGARVMDAILSTGPRGISLPRGGGGPRIHAPAPYRESAARGGPITIFPERRAAGGVKGQNETPVLLSHGEYCILPHHCARIGSGDVKRGHQILDAWVVEQRKKIIKKMKELPPPVGAKK